MAEVSMWLVQRLHAPLSRKIREGHPIGKAHRVFGGGMMGLTESMWDFIDEAFTLDYMGAAEYEMGTFPASMKRLIDEAKEENLTAFTMTVKRADVSPNPSRKYMKKGSKPPPVPTGDVILYVMCREPQKFAVMNVIRGILSGTHRTKDDTQLLRTIDPISPWDGKTVGWYALDSDVFFFVDEQMWSTVKGWFDLE